MQIIQGMPYHLNILNEGIFPQKEWHVEIPEFINFDYGDIITILPIKGKMADCKIMRHTRIKYYFIKDKKPFIDIVVKVMRKPNLVGKIIRKLQNIISPSKSFVFQE